MPVKEGAYASSGGNLGAGAWESVLGAFFAGVDVDAHSFTAGTGDRVYATTMTGFRGGSAGTLRDIIVSDRTTVLEGDCEKGAIGSASNIAGTVLATAGTYYARGRRFNITSLPGTIRPWDFYVRVRSGSPAPEMEAGSFASAVNGGGMIVAMVDVDPERAAPEWNVIAEIGVFTGSFIITL